MTPIRLSNTWSQRVYVGLFSLSFIFVVLYALKQYSSLAIPDSFTVDGVAVGGALLGVIGSIIGFIFVKKTSSFIPMLVVFAAITLTTAYVALQTGGVSSPFIALWTVLVFFAPLFGAYGWLPMIILVGVHVATLYLENNLTTHTAVLIALTSVAPVITGMIIWRDPPGAEDTSAKNVKNLATQLSEVAQKSEIVINAIGDGVIALDGKGVIQLINPAAQEILGWGKQDALMLSYRSILKLTDTASQEVTPDKDPIEQVLNTNQQARSNKLIALTQSGKKINVALVVSPIGNPGAGAIAVFRDITNERAEEREQAEFISTASHEMRTPVASIEGYLGLALNPNTAQIDARGRDFIMKAHEAAQHLGRLFQDLLDVSKSEDGRMTNIPKVVDVVAFTQTIVEGLAQKANDKGLQLVFKPTESSGPVKKIMPVYFVNQDNDHIREIIDNLIENAIKYTLSGSVTIDVNGTDEKVVVSIQDTGLGIPPEDVPHLFQKFYRVNNADRQEIGGTGLGLYLARRLAEAMQGRLWVESEFQKGSTFFLELPRIDSQEATHLKEQQAQQVAQTVPAAQPVIAVTPPTPIVTSIPVTSYEPPATQTPQTPVAQAPTVQPAAPQPPTATQVHPPTAALQATPPVPLPMGSRPAPQLDPGVRPATTVPRGESLTRDQIAERVKQLEALSQQQRNAPQER